ncbi:hypothetical protein [Desulfitobacterium chlororespirans]|uniref:Uncharacterized protein n=1 Tax=Desulfitobacterium chlororespirans DSM 11544 TaxID=1121395 RepID=A0A1M7UY70_9FIRM|nr:hypothetical protein [Desulfitobacterium chlororespirans]SHN87918.1 hypothetical protein SAMN02745215_05028 [Desulfitobacterium chlororespirans DSM 11544]
MRRLSMLFALLSLCLFIPSVVLADDNAEGGEGGVGGSEEGYAHYNSGEYMYKVSIYVGLSDQVKTSDSTLSRFKMIGNAPIYVRPSHFTPPVSGIMYGNGSKIDYQNGLALAPTSSPHRIAHNPPAPPVVSGGNINAVKDYFGDTETLNAFIDAFADQKGTTREGLVSGLQFTIQGETVTGSPDRILPVKDGNGNYKNEVPWLVVYEPVIIAYLKDGTTKLAFTATEYALAQKLGYFNFGGGTDGQMITAMTHRGLPNSITLEYSWFGFPVTPPLAEGVNWANERIIMGGGWGMRFLSANATGQPESPPTSYDKEYRTNTDVITSVEVRAFDRITPNTRAYVHFTTSTGQSGTHPLVIPAGGSQLAWFKWRTPSTPQNVTISISISGNSSARIAGSSSATIQANVVELEEKTPPDTQLFDLNPEGEARTPDWWRPMNPPLRNERKAATWGEWNCYWVPNWVFFATEDGGGFWVDLGDWEYEWLTYSAELDVTLDILPNKRCPTAKAYFDKWQMPAGYGIDLELRAISYYTGNSNMVTGAQNAMMYFPEFDYTQYNRVLDLKISGFNAEFWFKVNPDSHYADRVHYTPIWFPKNMDNYEPQVVILDMWTPAGMLTAAQSNTIVLKGAAINDWHIKPADPADMLKRR